jgi:hypothetical protein
MLHGCGIALCKSEAASGEVWFVLCPLCFSGSLLFGIRAGCVVVVSIELVTIEVI